MSEKLNEKVGDIEQQEEDVPESFFDDLMSEDFIEGLNVVDTWEGDDAAKQNISTSDFVDKTHFNAKPLERLSKSPSKNVKQAENVRVSNEREKKKKRRRRDKDNKDSGPKILGTLDLRRRLERSKSTDHKSDGPRRDPTKTHRDILKDKDKCEKDKTTKMIHEKLKVVETGLVPPGMEMEMETQNSNKVKIKLEEGEIPAEVDSAKDKKSKNTDHKRDEKSEKSGNLKHSRSKDSPKRRNLRRYSPDYRRIRSRSRSRSRSPKRRQRSRSRSMGRRMERRKRSRTRSRSFERGRDYKYRSPPRKTSPLSKRNINLHKQIDILRAKLYSNALQSPTPTRNIQEELLQSARNAQGQAPLMDISKNFMNNPGQFPQPVPTSMPNTNFIPLQPVPPPQPHPMELDQQFFIGQPAIDPNPYQVPVQNVIMHNPPIVPLGPPEIQQNFLPNWSVDQPPPSILPNIFNNQQNLAPPFEQQVGFTDNQLNTSQQQQNQMPFILPPNIIAAPQPVPPVIQRANEEEIFMKLFTDNKITLSDYLSVTAKTTDNSNPVDIQNKIKVITNCQEALHEINGNIRPTGKFLLRKSFKSPIKVPNLDGLSPFKKVPVIKFQFTTYSKQAEDKPQVATSLNKLMFKLSKDTQFEELPPPPVSTNAKSEQKEVLPKPARPVAKKVPKVLKKLATTSSQTEPPIVKDFGCQVNPEDIPSPVKTPVKKQSLAQLTPAQLLAQAEREESSPPPAPRWTPPADLRNRLYNNNWENFNDMDNMDRRSRIPGLFDLPVAGRPFFERMPGDPTPGFVNRSPEYLHHLYYGNRP